MKTLIKIFLLLQLITCITVSAQTTSSCVKAMNLWKCYDYTNAKTMIDDCIKNNFKNSSNWYIRGIIYLHCYSDTIDQSTNKKELLEQSLVSFFNVITLEVDGKLYTRLADIDLIKEKIMDQLYTKESVNNIDIINDIFFDKFLQIENEIYLKSNYEEESKIIYFIKKKTLSQEYCSKYLKPKINKDFNSEVNSANWGWLYETKENGNIEVIRDGVFVKIYNKTGSDIYSLEIEKNNIGFLKNNAETDYIQFETLRFDSGSPRPRIKGYIDNIEVNKRNYIRCGTSLENIKFGTYEFDLIKGVSNNEIQLLFDTHKK